MPEKHKTELTTILQILQVVVLGIGLGGVFIQLGEARAIQGQNSTQLVELKTIVQDLVKAQLESAATDAILTERIDALRIRLDRIDN